MTLSPPPASSPTLLVSILLGTAFGRARLTAEGGCSHSMLTKNSRAMLI